MSLLLVIVSVCVSIFDFLEKNVFTSFRIWRFEPWRSRWPSTGIPERQNKRNFSWKTNKTKLNLLFPRLAYFTQCINEYQNFGAKV